MNLIKNAERSDLIPSEFYLSQNFPNPFVDKTTIKFCVAYKTKVRLEVFNSEGELIIKLLDEEMEAGTYQVEFKASNLNGSGRVLPDGIYFFKLNAGNYSDEKKMIISNNY